MCGQDIALKKETDYRCIFCLRIVTRSGIGNREIEIRRMSPDRRWLVALLTLVTSVQGQQSSLQCQCTCVHPQQPSTMLFAKGKLQQESELRIILDEHATTVAPGLQTTTPPIKPRTFFPLKELVESNKTSPVIQVQSMIEAPNVLVSSGNKLPDAGSVNDRSSQNRIIGAPPSSTDVRNTLNGKGGPGGSPEGITKSPIAKQNSNLGQWDTHTKVPLVHTTKAPITRTSSPSVPTTTGMSASSTTGGWNAGGFSTTTSGFGFSSTTTQAYSTQPTIPQGRNRPRGRGVTQVTTAGFGPNHPTTDQTTGPFVSGTGPPRRKFQRQRPRRPTTTSGFGPSAPTTTNSFGTVTRPPRRNQQRNQQRNNRQRVPPTTFDPFGVHSMFTREPWV